MAGGKEGEEGGGGAGGGGKKKNGTGESTPFFHAGQVESNNSPARVPRLASSAFAGASPTASPLKTVPKATQVQAGTKEVSKVREVPLPPPGLPPLHAHGPPPPPPPLPPGSVYRFA